MQWTVQTSGIGAILAQLSKSTIFDYHKAGTCFYTSHSQSPRFDLTISDWWSTNTDNFDIGNNALAVSSLYASGLEGGIFQQNLPITGISTMRLLDTANTLGQKIFTGNTLTWGSISSDLAAGWDSAYVSYFNAVSNSESRVLVVNAEGDTEIGEWVGGAWLEMSIGLYAMASIIAGNIAGGGTSDPLTKGQTNDGAKKIPEQTQKSNPCSGCTCAGDPVSLFSGNCLNDHTDIVVGRGAFPYSLQFARHYDSASRLVDGPLGLGWTHNLDTRIAVASNGLRALGETSPKEASLRSCS